MAEKFKIGDIVQLNSGGPKMLFIQVGLLEAKRKRERFRLMLW
ncbi:DUF2158 domain-containing protein [Aromatoleum buckelii]|uniref:DUF2158 domain-containing protein n=1 Tax=Aromatoleum buckelii TaxID=200254 RepID=A0ABX1N849_9RHOO|nr:DUF2158 domain-containing protein [Aromatoleum buckelii]MCK0512800.1 DUF2158 domain-containing protein [Aromatoleum buckelii]